MPPTPLADRRHRAALAGHQGDLTAARAAVDDPDGTVRRLGLSALARLGRLDDPTLSTALVDDDPTYRRRACELAAHHPAVDLAGALADPDARVVEMAAWAVGERPYAADEHRSLRAIAAEHDDALCRESAVAALGALGHDDGLPVILAALDDIATVRRRAVVALAPFDTPEVTAALENATHDRDPQVRQTAEDLLLPPTRDT